MRTTSHAPRPAATLAAGVSALFLALGAGVAGQQAPRDREGFRFKSAVELVNVTVTVTDASGRFVPGLRPEDFRVYDDGDLQEVSHFDAERVPVSLGIAVDTSGSMAGDKARSARDALARFLFDLLDANDEVFVYRFSDQPYLVEGWTSDRQRLARALDQLRPRGGTALYDTVAEAIPLAQSGEHRKKALVVISDGNDTASSSRPDELKQLVRETEVIVYAVGIDQEGDRVRTITRGPRMPFPLPLPLPGRRTPPWPGYPPTQGGGTWSRGSDAANIAALRELTDDSGGRTEVVRSASDLDPATASIADELSRQYYLGYPAPRNPDGRWHTIRVEVRNRAYHVRARRGYVASRG